MHDDVGQHIDGERLDDRVFLLGRRDDVPDLLKELDVLVLPSLREGTPMALLEAMGVGRAVLGDPRQRRRPRDSGPRRSSIATAASMRRARVSGRFASSTARTCSLRWV